MQNTHTVHKHTLTHVLIHIHQNICNTHTLHIDMTHRLEREGCTVERVEGGWGGGSFRGVRRGGGARGGLGPPPSTQTYTGRPKRKL